MNSKEKNKILERLKTQYVAEFNVRHWWVEKGKLIEFCTIDELNAVKEILKTEGQP